MFDRAPARRGQERVPAVAGGVRLRAAASFLDRFAELVPSLPVHSAGHPPGLLVVMHFLALDTATAARGVLHRRRGARAPLTYVLARQLFDERTAGSPACSPRSRPRCCTSARPPPTPCSSRSVCSPRSRCSRSRVLGALVLASSPVRLVAARGRRLGGDPRPAPRRPQAGAAPVDPDRRRDAARVPRPVRARHRLRPDRHAAAPPTQVYEVGIASRRPYSVLALRLPDRVPADPRRADRLAGAPAGSPPRPRRLAIFAVLAISARRSASPRPRPSASGSSSSRS